MNQQLSQLLASARECRLCEKSLPLGPRPVLQVDPRAKILIAGQAPGRRVHESGIPFDDPSGVRLREWLLSSLQQLELTLVIGQYAQRWHLPQVQKNLTETVRAWRDYGPGTIPLPHPSPRNNIWLKRNPWFLNLYYLA